MNRSSSPDGSGLPHWSFGVPSPFSHLLQRWLVSHPYICAILSVKSVALETLAPVVIVMPWLGCYFAVAGVGFHYGIALFQNIDFVTWWGPFYALFLWEDAGVTANIADTVAASTSAAPIASSLMLGYLLLHLAGIVYAGVT